MPELNKGVIGKTYKPVEMEVKQHESIYYALATNDPNPFYINGSREGGIIAPPMFAVVYAGALTIKGGKLADNLIGFEATRPGGELVITTGRAELGEVAL